MIADSAGSVHPQKPYPDALEIRERYLWVARDDLSPTLSVAISHGGAGAAAWAELFPGGSGGAHLAAIRLPGRESRLEEPLSYEVEALGVETASTIASLQGKRRLVMVGVCFGAVVAYATALQLSKRFGIRPAVLIAVDARFGTPPSVLPPPLEDPAFAQFVEAGGFFPDWVWSDSGISRMLQHQFHADMSAHLSYRWPDCGGSIVDEVIVITGREVDVATAVAWERVADRISVIDADTYPHNMLIDAPGRLGEIISCVTESVVRRAR